MKGLAHELDSCTICTVHTQNLFSGLCQRCSALLFSTAVAADCSPFITVPGRCIPLPVAQWQLSVFFWGGVVLLISTLSLADS